VIDTEPVPPGKLAVIRKAETTMKEAAAHARPTSMSGHLRKPRANKPVSRCLAVVAVSTSLIAAVGASAAAAAPLSPPPDNTVASAHPGAPARPLTAVATSVRPITFAPADPIAAKVTASRSCVQSMAHIIVPPNQFASFSEIISHESGWNMHATNPSSGAYGLGQALPPSKMAAAGSDWRNNPRTQLCWTYNYMNSRYGSPNAAWAFWQEHHWY